MKIDYRSAGARDDLTVPVKGKWWLLGGLNVALCALSLRFLPLVLHIFACDHGSKWCHFQALLLGTPLGVGAVALGLPSLLAVHKRREQFPKVLQIFLVVPPLLAAAVVMTMAIAVFLNSQ